MDECCMNILLYKLHLASNPQKKKKGSHCLLDYLYLLRSFELFVRMTRSNEKTRCKTDTCFIPGWTLRLFIYLWENVVLLTCNTHSYAATGRKNGWKNEKKGWMQHSNICESPNRRWEVKPTVACSTHVSFFYLKKWIKQKSAALVLASTWWKLVEQTVCASL